MTVSPSISPEAIEHFRTYDKRTHEPIADSTLDALASAMGRARRAANTIEEAHAAITKDETMTATGRLLRAREVIMHHGDKAASMLDDARRSATAEIERMERAMAIPIPADPAERALHAEIRARFQSMPDQERHDVLAKAIAEDNQRIVHAVLADRFLSGLGDATFNKHLHDWKQKHHADQTNRIERLGKALAAFDRGGKALMSIVNNLAESASVQLLRAEAAHERAEQAIDAAHTE